MSDFNKTCNNCLHFRRYFVIGKTSLFAQDCGKCKQKSATVGIENCCELWKVTTHAPLNVNDRKRILKALQSLLLLLNEELQ